jgi:hypothetical protein
MSVGAFFSVMIKPMAMYIRGRRQIIESIDPIYAEKYKGGHPIVKMQDP